MMMTVVVVAMVQIWQLAVVRVSVFAIVSAVL